MAAQGAQGRDMPPGHAELAAWLRRMGSGGKQACTDKIWLACHSAEHVMLPTANYPRNRGGFTIIKGAAAAPVGRRCARRAAAARPGARCSFARTRTPCPAAACAAPGTGPTRSGTPPSPDQAKGRFTSSLLTGHILHHTITTGTPCNKTGDAVLLGTRTGLGTTGISLSHGTNIYTQRGKGEVLCKA